MSDNVNQAASSMPLIEKFIYNCNRHKNENQKTWLPDVVFASLEVFSIHAALLLSKVSDEHRDDKLNEILMIVDSAMKEKLKKITEKQSNILTHTPEIEIIPG